MWNSMDINYRHEVKHYLNWCDLMSIRARLRAVMQPDPHAKDGKYIIRSLYFDNPADKALREKIDGVNLREKFRIRYYNGDTSFIHLEKKSKHNSLGTKYDAPLSAIEAQRIVDGDIGWMLSADRPLVQELYVKMKYQGLRPKTILDGLTLSSYATAPIVVKKGSSVVIHLEDGTGYPLPAMRACTLTFTIRRLLQICGGRSSGG